jgi:hypothetical protein
LLFSVSSSFLSTFPLFHSLPIQKGPHHTGAAELVAVCKVFRLYGCACV